MTTYAHEDLKRILDAHQKWLKGEEGGARADLSDADLSDADLSGADLRRADLSDADLSGADLSDADLRRAVLRRAVLRRADLRRADLSDADLSGADLRRADLSGADLSGADLRRADLSDEVVLSDGVTWGQYKKEVVPALLVAGGKALSDVANPEVWDCHSWNNCPMHAAFDANTLEQVPALYRWQAERFIQLFDARLIPLSAIRPDLEAATA